MASRCGGCFEGGLCRLRILQLGQEERRGWRKKQQLADQLRNEKNVFVLFLKKGQLWW